MIETQMAESQQYCTQQLSLGLLSLQQFTSWTDQPMPFASRKVQYMTNQWSVCMEKATRGNQSCLCNEFKG